MSLNCPAGVGCETVQLSLAVQASGGGCTACDAPVKLSLPALAAGNAGWRADRARQGPAAGGRRCGIRQ